MNNDKGLEIGDVVHVLWSDGSGGARTWERWHAENGLGFNTDDKRVNPIHIVLLMRRAEVDAALAAHEEGKWIKNPMGHVWKKNENGSVDVVAMSTDDWRNMPAERCSKDDTEQQANQAHEDLGGWA